MLSGKRIGYVKSVNIEIGGPRGVGKLARIPSQARGAAEKADYHDRIGGSGERAVTVGECGNNLSYDCLPYRPGHEPPDRKQAQFEEQKRDQFDDASQAAKSFTRPAGVSRWIRYFRADLI